MSTISSGLVKIGTLTVSGTQSGAVQATTINASGGVSAVNVNASGNVVAGGNVSAVNLNASGSVLASGNVSAVNLNASGNVVAVNITSTGATTTNTFNCTGLNNYVGNYQIGDLISYRDAITNIGLGTAVSAATCRTYFEYWYGALGQSGFYNAATPNYAKTGVHVYEIAYWGLDTRTSQPTRLSGTVIVPLDCSSNTLISYKHGTLLSYNKATLNGDINNLNLATLGSAPGQAPFFEPTPLQVATQGYVTVVADNLSYGKSTGFYPFQDPQSEAMSQYAALVATTQLITLVPSLFSPSLCTGFTIPTNVNVISSGYSLGGMYSATVSQLIRNSSKLGSTTGNTNANSKGLVLKNTVAGAPVPAYRVLQTVFEGTTDGSSNLARPTNWQNINLMGQLLAGNGSMQASGGYTQAFIQNAVPSFTWIQDAQTAIAMGPITLDPSTGVIVSPGIYQPLVGLAAFNYVSAKVAKTGVPPINTYLPGTYVVPTTVNWLPGFNDTSAGWVIPSALYNYSGDTTHNFALDYLKQFSFYTNPFLDYTDLSGQPITTIYGLQDELCCYDSSHWNFGTAAKDMIAQDLSGFIGKITPVAGYYGTALYNPTPINVSTQLATNIGQIVLSESGAVPCQTSTWDCTGLLPVVGFNHQIFAIDIWSNVVCGYATARL